MMMLLLSILILSLCDVAISDSCPNIIGREEWDARSPNVLPDITFPVSIVIIQHTVTEKCTKIKSCKAIVKNIQNYHIDATKFTDIAYNFLIGDDGNVYEGRGWHKQGAHLSGYNKKSIGIAFIGNFKRTLPSDNALQAAKALMACGVELGELSPDYELYGAKQLSATQSPGAELYNRIRNWDHFTIV